MIKTRVSRFIPLTSILIAVFSVQIYSTLPIGNTFFWWLIQALIIFVFFWEIRYGTINDDDKKGLRFIKWYLIWNVVCIVRGVFIAEDYWQFKNLVGMGMVLLIPLFVYISQDNVRVQSILSLFVRYSLLVAIPMLPFVEIGAWGWYFFPISFLLFFFPVLPLRGKIFVLIITLFVVLIDLGNRSIVIKYSVAILFVVSFYYSHKFPFSDWIMKFSHKILMILPLVLFFLAVSGIFNIFRMDEYIEGEHVVANKNKEGEMKQENLTGDTRTFLYVEVIQSAIKYDYYIWGRSPARGNETVWFAQDMIDVYGYPERFRNETGILNVFTWTGLIGIIFYFLIFYKASITAIKKSNNIFGKLIGLYVAFRWAYCWVEDYQKFDMNNFVLWMMIGLCLSSSFRNMTNAEVKLWVRGIFGKRDSEAFRKYSLEVLS